MNGPVKVCADQWNFLVTGPLDQWLNFLNFYPWSTSEEMVDFYDPTTEIQYPTSSVDKKKDQDHSSITALHHWMS